MRKLGELIPYSIVTIDVTTAHTTMETFVINGRGPSPDGASFVASRELRDWLGLSEGEIHHLALTITHVPTNDRDAQYVCTILVVFKPKS
jgi:hypothetical protein